MYTECPECHTYFKITPEQLKAAEGKVRCGSCNHVFNALTNLAEKASPSTPKNSPPAQSTTPQESVAAPTFDEPQDPVHTKDEPESIVAFQVTDPVSEAALSEISLPLTAGSLGLNGSDIAASEKDALSLEGLSDLVDDEKAVASVANPSSAELSGIDLSEMQLSEAAPTKDAVSSVKADSIAAAVESSKTAGLSGFSALDSVVDEIAPKTPSVASSLEASEIQSTLSEISSIDEKLSLDIPPEKSEVVSFADVDVPGTESGPGEKKKAASDELDDINKDIDNALDNLFDEDELNIEEPKVKPDSVISELANEMPSELAIDALSEQLKASPISEISGLDSLSELDDSFLEKDVSEKDLKKKAVSEFELDDDFLSSDPLKGEEVEWEPLERPSTKNDNFSGENFKLEEMQESNSASTGGASRIVWVLLVSLLLVFLLGQFAYLKREELAKYPSIRPILEQACGVLSAVVECTVPDPRDLDAIVIVDRNVVSHPNAKNALLITSTVNNEADFVQMYPQLVLTFSDINQKVLARRTFKPDEYLAKGVDIGAGMQPNVPIKIMLEIVDPGEAAVNFEFDFF